ncbi:MAG: MTH938/NDUFAF3 family protein [Alphaproteobacteria bacterium]
MLREEKIEGACPSIISYQDGSFTLENSERYQGNLLISSLHGVCDLDVASPDDATISEWLKTYDVVLWGSGSRRVLNGVSRAHVALGVEVMATDAAVRTFNACLAEKRRVIAWLQPPHQDVT